MGPRENPMPADSPPQAMDALRMTQEIKIQETSEHSTVIKSRFNKKVWTTPWKITSTKLYGHGLDQNDYMAGFIPFFRKVLE